MKVTLRLLALASIAAVAAPGCGEADQPQGQSAGNAPPSSATRAEPEDAPPASAGREHDRAQPQQQPERPLSPAEVTRAVLTRSGSPEQGCEELVTDRFVRNAYGGRAGCLAARQAGGLARSLEGAYFNPSGEQATGAVIPEGGPYDGIEVEVKLVPDPEIPDSWLVDSLVADIPAGP